MIALLAAVWAISIIVFLAVLGVAWYWIVIGALALVIVGLMVAIASFDPWRV